MVGAAIALGLFAGVIEQRRRATRVYPYYPPQADAADVMPEDGRSREPSGVYPFDGLEHARAEAGGRRLAGRAVYPESTAAGAAMWKPVREVWQELSTEFAQERDRLQQAALLAGRSFLQDLVRIAGQSLIDQLSRPAGSGTSGRANPSRLRVTGGNTP